MGITYAIHLFGTVIQVWLPEWLRWLDWLMWPLFGIIVFGVVFLGFSLVANLIAAPFNRRLAQAVETHLRRESAPAQTGWRTALRELVTSLGSELRRVIYFAFWSLPLLVLSWLPGLGLPAALAWFVLGRGSRCNTPITPWRTTGSTSPRSGGT